MQWKKSFIRTPYKMKNYYFYFFLQRAHKMGGGPHFLGQTKWGPVCYYVFPCRMICDYALSLSLKKKLSEK